MKNNTTKAGRHGKPVKQMAADGKIIAVYNSLTEAAAATGISVGNICSCCNGKRKQANGFSWQYIE